MNKIIKEFEDYLAIGGFGNLTEIQRFNLIVFFLSALEQKDEEWKERVKELEEKAWKYDDLCK